ncbi:MAG: exodeoxyribonuclease VII large subunit [Bacteroidetes bacterium RIFCSPHIGHO2_02_FULL_44_7]|nr:MAG: exodeoxyribonuclease VII large subunit [Bacteroidetes bacterium RIFCSPHIGHO2_02_FULL_44_7]
MHFIAMQNRLKELSQKFHHCSSFPYLYPMSANEQVFTLLQVTQSIRKTIEERYQRLYWVKAEMHRLNRFASGHCFPELLQKEDGKIVAEMRGTIWKQQFDRINVRFMEVVKEPLKEDTTLLMQVRVSYHETYGLSLLILDIDPNYALGELQRERQETLLKIQKEGLLNANQALPFPLLPKRVAVISAEASKGLLDFYKIIEQNSWGYHFFTMLFPASLQGDLAAKSIVQQLRRIERVKQHFDIVVIVRGGGGEVGLSCYNNYALCREIAAFPLPVLTGIGHSNNMTVAEMVAFRNAITPTELGEFLLQAFHNFSVPVKDAIRLIRLHSRRELERERARFGQLSIEFRHTARAYMSTHGEKLHRSAQNLRGMTGKLIQVQREQLRTSTKATQNNARYLFQAQNNLLQQSQKALPLHARSILRATANSLENVERSVRLMDPINVLKRGYSITSIRGKSISLENTPQIGDEITTQTAHYILVSALDKVKKNDPSN